MIVRMRFAARALEELRKKDLDTLVSLHYIRSLAASKTEQQRKGGSANAGQNTV